MPQNTISIITATYYAAEDIRECLECVKQQNAEVEHIVIDGMSKDATKRC